MYIHSLMTIVVFLVKLSFYKRRYSERYVFANYNKDNYATDNNDWDKSIKNNNSDIGYWIIL